MLAATRAAFCQVWHSKAGMRDQSPIEGSFNGRQGRLPEQTRSQTTHRHDLGFDTRDRPVTARVAVCRFMRKVWTLHCATKAAKARHRTLRFEEVFPLGFENSP